MPNGYPAGVSLSDITKVEKNLKFLGAGISGFSVQSEST